MTPTRSVQALLEDALAHHQQGAIQQAIERYEAILREAPDHPDALHFMGVAASQMRQPARAEVLIRKAIAAFAGNPVFYVNLANAIRESGDPARTPEIEAALRQSLAMAPDLASARHNLGNLLYSQGRNAEAATEYAAVLVNQPRHEGALTLLARLKHQFGQLAEAIALYRRALDLPPTLAQRTQLLLNIATIHVEQGDSSSALSAVDAALAAEPRHYRALLMRGDILSALQRLHEASLAYEKATQLSDSDASAWAALARCRQELGDLDGGRAATLSALMRAADAHQPANYSAALMRSLFDATAGNQLAQQHRAWNRHFALPLSTTIHTPKNDPTPDRRLRIAYLSGDLRAHPHANLIAPVIAAHHRGTVTGDAGNFAIHLYSSTRHPDSRTQALRAMADGFHDVSTLSDQALVEQIEADGIDILIELSGHAEGNRLTALARRPAPIQLSWFGHPQSTGLSTIDARISDAVADPILAGKSTPGASEGVHDSVSPEHPADPLLHLSVPSLTCHWPSGIAPLLAGVLPASRSGQVTFGFCGNLAHLCDATLDLWSRVLISRPACRLLIAAPGLADPYGKSLLENRLQGRGISPQRLDLFATEGDTDVPSKHWQAVDLGLDSVLCSTASASAALMVGVPVITLAGDRYATRISASLLTAAGLDALIADSPEKFVSLALGLVDDLPALINLRATLPEQIRCSPLGDAKPLVNALESALRARWMAWCAADANTRAARTPEWQIAVTGGLSIVIPATFESMTPFVLLEQEDWFEDEIRFVRKLLQPGWTVLDIGANFGLYSTACARLVGPQGHVFAFEPAPNTARFLAKSCALNGLNNVHIVEAALSNQDGEAWIELNPNPELNRLVGSPANGLNVERVPIFTLDRWAADQVRSGAAILPDLIKLDAEGHEHQVLDGGAGLLANSSPIVLFEIKHGVELNHGLAEHFVHYGFDLYRLIPGLGLLAPAGTVNSALAADAFLLNLFAIKPERAKQLEAAGMLVSTPTSAPDAGQLPTWQESLIGLDAPPMLDALWKKMSWSQRKGSDGLERALRYYAAAKDSRRDPNERLACLRQAMARISAACEARPTPSRLLTLGRIAIDLGQQAIAGEAAQRGLSALSDQLPAVRSELALVDEPMLPGAFPLSQLDSTRPLPWLRASLMERHLKTTCFSGCFADFNEQHDKLEQLAATGFINNEMLRRQQLVRLCQGKPLDPAALIRLSQASESNLNAGYWAKQASNNNDRSLSRPSDEGSK